MSASSSQWTPSAGRHQVSMGKSMTRFLKQRKGIQQTGPSKALPTTSFYHFRYKFMPESVDTDKPGVLELTSKDVTTARVERGCQQSDQVHTFRGREEPAKEVECVLLYDPESGLFTLEKLDSSLTLQYENRSAPKNRHPSASPLPTEPSPVASTLATMSEDPLLNELEKELAGELNDSDDEDIPLSASSQIVADRRRQAVSQVPQPIAPVAAPSKATGTSKSKPKLKGAATSDVAPVPKSTKSSTPTKKAPAPAASKPVLASSKAGQKSKAKGKTVEVDEEVFDLGKAARPSVNSLALPTPSGSGGGLVLPGPTSSGSDFVSLPGGPPASTAQYEDDDSDDWEKVAGDGDSAPGPSAGTGADEESMFGDHNFADTMEEIDINADVDRFAAEMDQELQEGLEEVGVDEGEQEGDGDDDMFGDNDMEEVTPQVTGKPMSISQLAAGAAQGDDDEDDYTSTSEDSDDD